MTMQMNPRVSLNINEGVADVRLNRADKMNALDSEMFEAIVDVGQRLLSEPGLRAVVLSGLGRGFCAGLDKTSFAAMAAANESLTQIDKLSLIPRTHGAANAMQYAATVWQDIPAPVIAAVHGVAFGGGLQLILGADLRYAAPATQFSVMEIKWGLVPDMGGTAFMEQLVRPDIIRDLSYSGRIFSAEEALAYGFITHLTDDPKASAMKMATEIASKNPEAIRAMKRMFNKLEDSTLSEILIAESVEQQALIGSHNQVEAVLANSQNRSPEFRDVKPV